MTRAVSTLTLFFWLVGTLLFPVREEFAHSSVVLSLVSVDATRLIRLIFFFGALHFADHPFPWIHLYV